MTRCTLLDLSFIWINVSLVTPVTETEGVSMVGMDNHSIKSIFIRFCSAPESMSANKDICSVLVCKIVGSVNLHVGESEEAPTSIS